MPHICEYDTQEPLETCRKHVCFEAFARTSALKHSKWRPSGAPPLDSPRNMLENTSVLGWPGAIARGPVRKCACFRPFCVPKPRPQRPSGEECLENTCVLLFSSAPLGRSGALEDARGRSGTLWAARGSGALWDLLGRSGPRSGAFWGVLGRSGAFWSVRERSGAFWSALERPGTFWSALLWSALGRPRTLRLREFEGTVQNHGSSHRLCFT